MARSNLREEFYRIRRDIASQLLSKRSKRDMNDRVDDWLKRHEEGVAHYNQTVDEMRLHGRIDFATLSVAAQELKHLLSI